MVTLTLLLTPVVTAVKVAALWPIAIVILAGICRAELLLDSFTVIELRAVALKDTEQVFDCAPVSDCVPQETPLSATPLPCELPVVPRFL